MSLSGFCEDNLSGVGGSIIDKLGEDNVPSLNLEGVEARKSNREVSEPITSIQNRLQYSESSELDSLVRTEEIVSEAGTKSENVNEEEKGVDKEKGGDIKE